jgi:hypothetical protein
MIGLMIVSRPAGRFSEIPLRSSCISAGLNARTYPATPKPTISSGTSDSTLKNVIAAA